jgi:hypothetical protein
MRGLKYALLRSVLSAVAFSYCVLSSAGETPYPHIPPVPKAKGEQCVEPTDVMRRDHMKFILHQRDDTVHGGIRTSRHSLKGCIDCHVTADANGRYPSIKSKDHFCSACHSYAAVQVDCFECHSDHPHKQPGLDRTTVHSVGPVAPDMDLARVLSEFDIAPAALLADIRDAGARAEREPTTRAR